MCPGGLNCGSSVPKSGSSGPLSGSNVPKSGSSGPLSGSNGVCGGMLEPRYAQEGANGPQNRRKRHNRRRRGQHMLFCTPSQFFQVKVDAQGSPRSRRSVPETTKFVCGGGRRQATPRCNSRCNTPHGSNLPNSGSSGPPSESNAFRDAFLCQNAPKKGTKSAAKPGRGTPGAGVTNTCCCARRPSFSK